MVKKLMKYEFASFAKSLMPMCCVLLGIAFLTRFIQLFENNSTTYSIFKWSSIIMLIIACVVTLIMTVAVCAVRFYKNMYTAEGYLTLTLPVTHNQHIFAKLFAAVCVTFISAITVFVAFTVASFGDVFAECMKALGYLIKLVFDATGFNTPIYIIEVIIVAAAVIAELYLLLYACITVGQLAKKNRVLAAFGSYFAYYIINQILGTVFIVVYAAFPEIFPLQAIFDYARSNTTVFIHLFFWAIVVYNALLSAIFYVITRHILVNKLNVE